MTTNELRAAAEELVHLHERFAPWFGRKEYFEEGKSYLGMAQYEAHRVIADAIRKLSNATKQP